MMASYEFGVELSNKMGGFVHAGTPMLKSETSTRDTSFKSE
jgi:hypothetical protein